MNRAALLLVLLTAACAAPGDAGPETVSETGIPYRLSVAEYDGNLKEYPPVAEAAKQLPVSVAASVEKIRRRTGLGIDEDRARRVELTDDGQRPTLETKIIDGRVVQIVAVPTEPIAQGRVEAADAVTEALAHAVVSDAASGDLPGWFALGVPLWVSGRWERLIHERVLADLPEHPDRVVPPIDLESRTEDPLASALFLRFVAEEFGAERVAALGRALLSADRPDEAIKAALDTDPASLPAGFDSYRVRIVGDLLDDEYVLALRESRARPAAERVTALSGLARLAKDRYVAAAILSELASAQFEQSEWSAAAATIARIERDYSRYAVRPDRDRFLFAMSFLRQGEDRAAELRLRTFLEEFPASPYVPVARYELGTMLLATDRREEATAMMRDLVRNHPEDPVARRARVTVGQFDLGRHRYALAKVAVEPALPDPEAERIFVEVLRAENEGPGEAGSALVRMTIHDLASTSGDDGGQAVVVLREIGPAALPLLDEALRGGAGTPLLRSRVAEVLGEWSGDRVRAILFTYLESEDRDVIGVGVRALLGRGIPPDRIRAAVERLPGDPTIPREVLEEVLLSEPPLPDLAPLIASDYFQDRITAASRLATRTEPEALAALARLVRDDSPQVRRAAAVALGRRDEPASSRLLVALLGDRSSLVRREAIGSLARLERWDTVRTRGLSDRGATVRLATAGLLLDHDDSADAPMVVALLDDPDPSVRAAVERLLEEVDRPWMGPALASALEAATTRGHATRIVRVISGLTGRDFGYDPQGDEADRKRVASELLDWWGRRASRD